MLGRAGVAMTSRRCHAAPSALAVLAAALAAACSDPIATAADPASATGAAIPEASAPVPAAAVTRTVYGLDDQNTLVVFDPATPATLIRRVPITGAGGALVGIDFRPNDATLADGDQTGLLYAVNGSGAIYTVDVTTGAATLRAQINVPVTAGLGTGVGFNPVADRLRIHTEAGQNLRVNVETGATVVDTPLAYATGDANAGRTPGIVATAYTNSVTPAPASTELYAIDATQDVLVRLDAPNDGRLTTVARLVVDNAALVGFDVPGSGADRVGYATFTPPRFTRSFFYRVGLDDGARQAVAPVGHDRPIVSLAVDERAAEPTPASLTLEKIGSYSGGGLGAAEITAFDPASRRLFVVNGALGTVDVLDLTTPSAPTRVASIGVSQFGAGANSVAVRDGIVALAIEGAVKTDPGTVAFYRASTLELVSSVAVGALPDMLTFSPSGRYVLTANEGEPSAGYTVDPEGSVSVIDVSTIAAPVARTAGFGAYNGRAAELRASGVRIYGPNASVAQDLEPEYIALSEDGRTAYVTLQENNALATVDVEGAVVTGIAPFGYKDHNRPGFGLDASDRDSPTVPNGPAINIRPWPVLGMYQPDAIASYAVNGQTYLVTANEGDARDYAGPAGLQEEARVSTLALNPSNFADALCGGPCVAATRLGRLTVTNQTGRNTATSLFDTLYVFGARSFSVWTPSAQLVYDSGDQFEQRTTAVPGAAFNASNTDNALDDRSDNKGPEPEGVVLGRFGAKTFAFIGLERIGGVIVYDVTAPASPSFVTYVNSRTGGTGDLGPEGLAFVPAAQSPNGRPLLIVGNEVSGTTAIFQINLQ